MDREAAARHAGIIPEGKFDAFLEYLVRYPELPKVLDVPNPNEARLQGDFLKELPCVHLNERGEPKVAVFLVAVINNTCDLEPGRSKIVNVTPVFDYRSYRDSIFSSREEASAKSFLASVRGNKVNEILFVAECPGYPEGVVIFLDRISSISVELYEQALAGNRRIASFTQNGFYVFLLKITKFLARAETPDVARIHLVPG